MQWGENNNMQSNSNGGYGLDEALRRKRLRWTIVILLIILLLSGIYLGFKTSSHPADLSKVDQRQSTVFQGMSGFVNNGLTTEQVNYLIQAFSKFSPNAKVVSINTATLTPGPHDPGSLNPFTILFTVSVDHSTYSGIASYSDLTSIRLTLNDNSGKQVFDSGIIPAEE